MADDRNEDQNPEGLAGEPPVLKEPAEGSDERQGEGLLAEPPIVAKEPAEGADETAAAMGLTLGSGSPAAEGEEAVPRPAPTIRGKVDRFGVALGTGRRKTGIARVRVQDGRGQFTINGRSLDEFFPIERDRLSILAVLKATETEGKVDVAVKVNGGGRTGQSGAIVLGLARALQAKNPNLHPILSEGGYLTRDSRMVERKKYGHKKARRSFQFSKR
jgi:small subunit ribosomal protein S9